MPDGPGGVAKLPPSGLREVGPGRRTLSLAGRMTAAALPPIDRPTGGGSEYLPGEVPNRVGAFFAGLLNGHRAAESVPAGAAD